MCVCVWRDVWGWECEVTGGKYTPRDGGALPPSQCLPQARRMKANMASLPPLSPHCPPHHPRLSSPASSPSCAPPSLSSEIRAQLTVLMGGRAAEQLTCDALSTGEGGRGRGFGCR